LKIEELRSGPWWTGVALAAAVSVAAGYAAEWIGVSLLGFDRSPVSAIMMAIVLGMLVANIVVLPTSVVAGVRFCATTILRIGIMLLGIRLSLASAGRHTLLALPFVFVAITVGLTTVGMLGRRIGMSRQLSGLIAVGTSICGCTAIVATAPVIDADESEVSYAVACITIFGLAAMFLYPILGHWLFPGEPALSGLFLGTSIHETAQVAGAGMMYQAQYDAPQALDIATITKLVRNLSMIAVIPLVGILYGKDRPVDGHGRGRWWTLIPWFIIGFAMMSALRTVGDMGERPFGVLEPGQWTAGVSFLKLGAERCLLVAMAGVGLTSMFSSMRRLGVRPFALGLLAALVVGGASLLMISVFGRAAAGWLLG